MLVNWFNLITLIVIFSQINCDPLTPRHCYDKGECYFDSPEVVCKIKCGPYDGKPSVDNCASSTIGQFGCKPKDYTGQYIQGTNMITISLYYCREKVCSNSSVDVNITILEQPTFEVIKSSFSLYDSIEHELHFKGTHFNSFYQPFIRIFFTRSKLLDPDVKGSCLEIINCTIIDENNLKCIKPAFRDECLPKLPEEFGYWDAEFLFYSHGALQIGLIEKRLFIHQVPQFNSTKWEPEHNKFIIHATGSYFVRSKVNCIILSTNETMETETFFFRDSLAFELDPYPLYKKPLNCSVVIGETFFPLGVVTIETIFRPPSSPQSFEIVLITASGFVLFTACLTWIIINNAQKNHQLRSQSALNFFPTISLREMIAKQKVIPQRSTTV